MNAAKAIKASMDMSNYVLDEYIKDLSDADLLVRPGPGCNHPAWQLGHLIVSHADLMNALAEGSAPALPAGFREKYTKETAGSNDPKVFAKKDEYKDLLNAQRTAAATQLEKLSDDDLDKPAPEAFRKMFPTAGQIWILIATHGLMHAGQFVPIRRMLGKPVVI